VILDAIRITSLRSVSYAPFAELTSNPSTNADIVATNPIASFIASLLSEFKWA